MARTTIPHIITVDSALGGNFDIERSCTFIRDDSKKHEGHTQIEENKKRPEKKKSKFRERLDQAMKQAQEQQQARRK